MFSMTLRTLFVSSKHETRPIPADIKVQLKLDPWEPSPEDPPSIFLFYMSYMVKLAFLVF